MLRDPPGYSLLQKLAMEKLLEKRSKIRKYQYEEIQKKNNQFYSLVFRAFTSNMMGIFWDLLILLNVITTVLVLIYIYRCLPHWSRAAMNALLSELNIAIIAFSSFLLILQVRGQVIVYLIQSLKSMRSNVLSLTLACISPIWGGVPSQPILAILAPSVNSLRESNWLNFVSVGQWVFIQWVLENHMFSSGLENNQNF